MSVAKAKAKFLRVAPRKVRLVADLIRGKNVEEALNILQFTNKGSSKRLAKLLKSAVSNADQKPGVNIDKLYVRSVQVDTGPVIKRFRPRAMGRATQILKRTAHVVLTLDQRA
jgi:large subunit ribosomal protein L22